jgi:hypothetical protein
MTTDKFKVVPVDTAKKYTFDELEQAAMFGADIDHDLIPDTVKEDMNGFAGIVNFAADQAVAFCAHHRALGADTVDAYWDAADWYVCSDAWFDEHLAPVLYADKADS